MNEQTVKKSGLNKHNALAGRPSFFESFEFLSSAASIGLIITDAVGNIITFNKTVENLFGFTLEKYKHTNVCELYANPEDRQRLLDMLAESSSVRDFEVKVKHADGSLRNVLANVDYIEYEGEHVLLTSLYDITQIFRHRANHITSDENYRALFSNAPVGITVTDIQGHLIVSNNSIRTLLGYTQDDMDSLSVREFYMSTDDRSQLISLTKELGSVRDFETTFRHKDGSPVAVLINTDIIEFNGKSDMLLTSIRDISHI